MNREEQIKKAHDLLSDGKFEEARILVESIKKQDADELEKKASDKMPDEDKTVGETKEEQKEEKKKQKQEKKKKKKQEKKQKEEEKRK